MEVGNINEKVFYRFVEFTSRLISYDLAHEDYKLIALNQKEANTLIEKKVKRIADTFLYLLNQTSQILDSELIKTAYYLLTKKGMSSQNIDKILKSYYLVKEEVSHVQAAKMIFIINKLKVTRKIEFSLLIGNYLLIKGKHFPVIFHETDKVYLKSLIKEDNHKDLVEYIYMHEYQTRHGIGSPNNNGVEITIDELVDKLKKNEEHLKKEFKINHMFIYGGMAKGNLNKSSDIDLLVDIDGGLVSYQKYDYISQAQKFLSSLLNVKLDVLDFSYSLKYAEIKEMNNTIKIF